MSRAERKTHAIKRVGRTWSKWQEIPVTDEIRNSAKHMEHVHSIWANSRFEAQAFQIPSAVGGIMQLVVARHGHIEPVSWNDMQRIKAELFGDSVYGMEIYPAESVTVEMKIRIIWIMPEGWEPPCGLHLPTAWGGR